MKTLQVHVARLERRVEEEHGPGVPIDSWARVLSKLGGSGTRAQVRIWRSNAAS